MEDRFRAPDGSAIAPISTEELGPLWESWLEGTPIRCPRDGGPLALAVDSAAQAYRLICVSCGSSSPWFETAPSGIQVRAGTSSFPAPRPTAGD